MVNAYRVKQNQKINLNSIAPLDDAFFSGTRKEGEKKLKKLNEEMVSLQRAFYENRTQKFLIVFQAMDAAGKDGTIRNVFKGTNPQGVGVECFKVPTKEELSHDFLWRIHKCTPRKGQIMLFNRSHYEDVLVTKVEKIITEKIWKQRIAHINNFEKLLNEEGTRIIKFYLHIDRDEQKRRFQKRLDNPNKQWKFNPGDLEVRKKWSEYMQTYQKVMSKTSKTYAPWYIIPANNKLYRNLVITQIIINELKKCKLTKPKLEFDLSGITIS